MIDESTTSILSLYEEYARRQSKTLAGYFDTLVIDSNPPKKFKFVREPWQDEFINKLIPLFESAVGLAPMEQNGIYIVASRGMSKTSTISHFVGWCLCYSPKFVSITVCAADKDQAHITLDRLRRESSHNPHLELHFNKYNVQGPTGNMDVISSDAPTASGRLDDVIILEELALWKKQDLMDVMFSGRHKRKNCLAVVITNAGIKDSWQHQLYLQAQQSPRWVTHEVPPFSASWLDRAAIEEDSKILLPTMFRRMHLNIWSSLADENGFVTEQQLTQCIDHAWHEQDVGKDYSYYVAIDYGMVHDRTVACVVHKQDDKIVLDKMRVWQGCRDNPVPITEVDTWLKEVITNFQVRLITFDPWNLEQLAQKFEREVEVERFIFSLPNHQRLADNLRSLIVNANLKLYHDEDLEKETLEVIVEEKANGTWRINHMPNKHDDRVIALAMATLACVREEPLLTAGMHLLEPEVEKVNEGIWWPSD